MKQRIVIIVTGLLLAGLVLTVTLVDKHNRDRESRERVEQYTDLLACYEGDRSDESLNACLTHIYND